MLGFVPQPNLQCLFSKGSSSTHTKAETLTLTLMRMKGLEPSLLSELEPKSSASANSATSARAYYLS